MDRHRPSEKIALSQIKPQLLADLRFFSAFDAFRKGKYAKIMGRLDKGRNHSMQSLRSEVDLAD